MSKNMETCFHLLAHSPNAYNIHGLGPMTSRNSKLPLGLLSGLKGPRDSVFCCVPGLQEVALESEKP